MTQGETIQMVRKAGFPDGIAEFIGLGTFEALIKLSAEHERKACAEHYLEIMRNAVQSAVEAEREACAEVAMTLTRRMKETEKAHYNHSAEQFIAERFGFERGLILEGQKIADAIRARNNV